MSVFARPRIAMQEREDGCLLLRSADPVAGLPGQARLSSSTSSSAQSSSPDAMKERGLPLPVLSRGFMLGVSASSTTMGGPLWKRTTDCLTG